MNRIDGIGRMLQLFIVCAVLGFGVPSQAAYGYLDLWNNATGGDCEAKGIGVWDGVTGTCTLTADISGQVIHINSDGITLDGNGYSLTGDGTGNGIWFSCRHGLTVRNLMIRNFDYGIYASGVSLGGHSTNILIEANTFEGNNIAGIYLFRSDNSILTGNALENNATGICLYYADNNLIVGNTVVNSVGWGISLCSSLNNTIFHNNFIGNPGTQGYISDAGNILDNGLPQGGNYWSHATLPDDDHDGIVDIAYTFDKYGIDRYPWTVRNGWMEPVVGDVLAAANPVGVNEDIILTATIDDAERGDSSIVSSQYRIDTGEWRAMLPKDGYFDTMTEDVYADLQAPLAAGFYNLCVRGTDQFGLISVPACTRLVVYDADAGYVVGGGKFASGEGAYLPDPAVTGLARFEFAAQYKKGKIVQGVAEFLLKAAGLHFKADGYEWLVVQGMNFAVLKGTGIVNGTAGYDFQIWATDDTYDTYRIKIWMVDPETAVETVTYDNGGGQELSKGEITITAD